MRYWKKYELCASLLMIVSETPVFTPLRSGIGEIKGCPHDIKEGW
jgi:hypothetical protein